MNLVNELQISAEKDDVLTVLRKARRLASKLGRQDIADWLKAEQNGYGSEHALPEYRQINAVLAIKTNGYVPAGFGMMKNGIEDVPGFGSFPVPMPDAISSILSMIENIGQGDSLSLPVQEGTEFSRSLRSHFTIDPRYERQITFVMRLNTTQVRAIPEQIKDKVLDLACDLEAAGVHGDGMSFSAQEKAIAHTTIFNIDRSTIDQLNNHGNNQKG